MDSFYEENQENNIKMLKNKMTLDFNSPTSLSKKSKFMKTCILESPDLKKLNLASPELERLIIAQNGMVTTTPTPSSMLWLKQEQEVTEEQERYAQGFVEALNQLHQTNGQTNGQPNGQQHPTSAANPSITAHNHCLNSSQMNNTNNCMNSNNNNRNCNQINSHLNNANNNQNINNCLSSDSSSDMTIDDNNCNQINTNINSRRNSYHMLAPVTSVSNTTVHYNGNNDTSSTCVNGSPPSSAKFAIPQLPSHEQYVTTCQTTGAQVLINPTVVNTSATSVLPLYSQAVNNSQIYPMAIKSEATQQSHQKANHTILTTNTMRSMSPSEMGSPPPDPSMAPIDMADQERIKLERKRLRNRIAASKCRRRKLERISKLEDKVKGLKGENSELSIVVNKLRDQVMNLKQQVMNHVKCGCQLMVPQ